MRVFVLGATGAVGSHLVPLLVSRGHEVVGATRSPEKLPQIRDMGAEAVVADALDRDALVTLVQRIRPHAIHHQMTAIPPRMNLARFDEEFTATNRLRTVGTDHVVEAAARGAVKAIIAQSFGGWPYARQGGPVKTEDDPLDPRPPSAFRNSLNAIRHLESKVMASGTVRGIVLRYGFFYGPRTSLALDGSHVADLRAHRFPIVGPGAGIWSFLHISDAASAAAAAMDADRAGLYNVADDDPAPVREWLPYLAKCLETRAPRRVPAWLPRLLIGEHAVVLMNEVRGLSNRKAKMELGWAPAFATWRTGFKEGLG